MDVGGMEMLSAEMARGLAARGHEVGITCIERDGDLAASVRAAGTRVSVCDTPGLRTLLHAPMLAEHFARLRPDVVHTHNGVWEKAARAAHVARVPMIGHTLHGLHHNEPWYFPPLQRWAARHSNWVAAVSHPLREYLCGTVRLSPEMVHVIINGIDTDRYHPAAGSGALRASLGLTADTPLVGIVARLVPLKNHALLLTAFERVTRTVPDAHLAIIGDGLLRNELRAHAAALDCAARVHFLGARHDLDRVYSELDVFALPSSTEGTSMSVLEAMASGTCVVASAVGGTPDLLAHGEVGLLVPSGDVDGLADALRRALTDPTSRQALRNAARRRVVEHFSLAAMLDHYEHLYRGAPSARNHASAAEAAACVG